SDMRSTFHPVKFEAGADLKALREKRMASGLRSREAPTNPLRSLDHSANTRGIFRRATNSSAFFAAPTRSATLHFLFRSQSFGRCPICRRARKQRRFGFHPVTRLDSSCL